MSKVTVLMPTFQSARYLQETLDSILRQSFRDFEILVVDDGSTDGTLEIVQRIRDVPVRVVSGHRKGLADALNLGIREAQGEYIARIDSDDLMVPERLMKQVAYMDSHPETAVCGGWQQYFGMSTFLHAPPSDPMQCKANLLYRCDLCHSTLMLRKDVFLNNNLFYSSKFAAEDFELWTRVFDYGEIANLGEVMGYFRASGDSITDAKKSRLIVEQGEIVRATLKRNLGIELTDRETNYFIGWVNPFFQSGYGITKESREKDLKALEGVLRRILHRNLEVGYYDQTALLKATYAEWSALCYDAPFEIVKTDITEKMIFRKRGRTKLLLEKYHNFMKNYPGLKRKLKKIYTYFLRKGGE